MPNCQILNVPDGSRALAYPVSSFQVRNTTTVSRSHAIFCVRDGVCTVMDDSSRNGTFVNGERLEPGVAMELEDGDTVRMSDVDFVFEVD